VRAGARLAAVLTAVVMLTAGCSAEVQRGWLPGGPGVTNMTDRITSLWTGSWIAALSVGVITWGLILWCVVVYRRRAGDETLPVQLRYHVPLEVMYVILPLIMVGVLYYYTQRDMAAIQSTSQTPDLKVQVIGKQWSWDFNYLDDGVWESGNQTPLSGKPGVEATAPTLYLPVGERVEFVLDSRDVIHSFWVPAFLYKKDIIPGRTNYFQIVPEKVGSYAGKCAELCGEFHSEMRFTVKVVPRAEYDAHIAALRAAGQTGALGVDYNRQQVVTGGAG
jgi:cytochrome c oxidase subunit 2